MTTRYLPIFPLRHVIFPGEGLNLHIFEPRYKQLVADCSQEGSTFGIPNSLYNRVGGYGTEMKIINIEKIYPNGEMDIKTEGLHVFKMLSLDKKVENKLYGGASIEFIEQINDYDDSLQENIIAQIQTLYERLNIDRPIGNFRIFDVAHHIGLSQEQEYQLLQINSERERQLYVLQHLKHIVPIIIEAEMLKQKVKLNGHFRKFDPLEWE